MGAAKYDFLCYLQNAVAAFLRSFYRDFVQKHISCAL